METTYSEARQNFAAYWDKVCEDRQPLILHRKGAEDIAMLPAAELAGLMETAHLLRSPANAKRLLAALGASLEGKGIETDIAGLRARIRNG